MNSLSFATYSLNFNNFSIKIQLYNFNCNEPKFKYWNVFSFKTRLFIQLPSVYEIILTYITIMTDFQEQYLLKSREFDELNEQFIAYQDQSALMIQEVQLLNEQLKNKNNSLQEEVDSLKEKRKYQTNNLEKEVDLLKKQKHEFKIRFEEFQRKVVELQNINETLQAQNRAANSMLNQYEQRVQKTMEELALLQVELQQNKSTNQEQVARLKGQIKETQQELYVLHLKHQKHNDESSQRMSRLSSSFSSSQEDFSGFLNHNQQNNENEDNISSILKIDFKKNKEPAFGKTINLVKNLISDIDQKARKLKNKKRISAT